MLFDYNFAYLKLQSDKQQKLIIKLIIIIYLPLHASTIKYILHNLANFVILMSTECK